MHQKLFQNFLITRRWSFWKQHRKGTVKVTLKIRNICVLYIYREYLLCLQSNASGKFLKTSICLGAWRLKFSLLKVAWYLKKVNNMGLGDDWAIPEKKSKQGGGWAHGISRGIEERVCGNSGDQFKKKWNLQRWFRKNHLEFWQVLVKWQI